MTRFYCRKCGAPLAYANPYDECYKHAAEPGAKSRSRAEPPRDLCPVASQDDEQADGFYANTVRMFEEQR